MTVDQQARWDIEEFQVTDDLGFVCWSDCLNDCQFKRQATFNEDVVRLSLIEVDAFVLNRKLLLARGVQALQFEFTHQTFLVDAPEKPRTERTAHFDRRADSR